MNRYVIERDVPGVGTLSGNQLREAAQGSKASLDALGTGIQWVESFVTPDRIYCVYLAETEQLVRDHAKGAGLPASRVSLVQHVLDPLTANA